MIFLLKHGRWCSNRSFILIFCLSVSSHFLYCGKNHSLFCINIWKRNTLEMRLEEQTIAGLYKRPPTQPTHIILERTAITLFIQPAQNALLIKKKMLSRMIYSWQRKYSKTKRSTLDVYLCKQFSGFNITTRIADGLYKSFKYFPLCVCKITKLLTKRCYLFFLSVLSNICPWFS